MDEELWKKTRNKKNLLKLLRKGDEELCKARIARTRELVAEEERLAEQERETRAIIDHEARENLERLKAEMQARRQAQKDGLDDDDFDDDDYDVDVEWVR